MSKIPLSRNQKRILYKNTGILIALTIVCAILARCGAFGGGETLEDLAEKQKQAAAADTDAPADETGSGVSEEQPENDPQQPETGPEQAETGSEPAENRSEPAENGSEPAENGSEPPQEGDFMEDRVTYQEGFYYESLSDTVKERITGISYPADDSNAAISYDMLRFVGVLYYDFEGNLQNGELICHKAIARDLVEIFYGLYEARYPIEKISLVDEYQGDDSLSMQDNNTSCFNYRALPSGRLSNHAYGLAIDLNPFYNPYVTTGKDGAVHISPAGSEIYADRDQSFDYKIDKEDLAYQLFIQHGFTWGGSWRSSKDYQHFEKEI